MKTIMYISRPTETLNITSLPPALARILMFGRMSNKRNNINSVIFFYKQCYIQIIEGEDVAVDDLFDRISNDTRHTNIQVLFNQATTKNFFHREKLRLVSHNQKLPAVVDYIQHYLLEKFDENCKLDKVLSFMLRYSSNTHLTNTNNMSFRGKTIKLKEWPRFDMMLPTQELLELCALIANHSVAYDDLCKLNPYSSEEELQEVLLELSKKSLLKVNKQSIQSSKYSEKSISRGFFGKMSRFIKEVAAVHEFTR